MSKDFERYARRIIGEELRSFEALCFNRAKDLQDPYSFLRAAPGMQTPQHVRPIVELAAQKSARRSISAQGGEGLSAVESFAYEVAGLTEGPGCVPQLISVTGPEESFEIFECNIASERGGALDGNFTEPYSCGLVWNSYHFIEDVIGKGSSIGLSLDHLTERGVAFAEWLFDDQVQAMRTSGRGS